ncbi:MAG: riboflavin synthase [Deltaproteobacteria bacterium]|nr:riboflavin synthase [Deltaproteobacteria bacterium]
MFTGLTLGKAAIATRAPAPGGSVLTIKPQFAWAEALTLGESVAVSGVCLTVEKFDQATFQAFASQETLSRSTLGRVTQVNLERALKLNDRLGGHLVSGHVDGQGQVQRVRPQGAGRELEISLPQELALLTVRKGSIAVDGVSLTVNEVGADFLTVFIIPATLTRTTLVDLAPGREVNLEVDLLAKYVQRLLTKPASTSNDQTPGLTLESLAQAGFL